MDQLAQSEFVDQDVSYSMEAEIIQMSWRLPRDVVERLKSRAPLVGKSVNQLVVDFLERSLSEPFTLQEEAVPYRTETCGHARMDGKHVIQTHDQGWVRMLGVCRGKKWDHLLGPGTSKATLDDLTRLLKDGADLDGQIVLYAPDDPETPMLLAIELQHANGAIWLRAKPVFTGGQWVRRRRQSFTLPTLGE